FFSFNTSPTTEIYTLSLHDALPIYIFRSSCCHDYIPNISRHASPQSSAIVQRIKNADGATAARQRPALVTLKRAYFRKRQQAAFSVGSRLRRPFLEAVAKRNEPRSVAAMQQFHTSL